MHFDVPRDFFDLVMKENLSSKSRATAFLWLMWWYLESDFSAENAADNPYGPGRSTPEADSGEVPIKCPQFEFLSDEQAALENVDTTEELEFGEEKRLERQRIISGDMQPIFSGPKRGKKGYPQNPVFSVNTGMSNDESITPSRGSPATGGTRSVFRNKPLKAAKAAKLEDGSDSDETRSASPARSGSRQGGSHRIASLLNDDTPAPPPKGPGRGNWRRNRDNADGSAPRSQPKGPNQYLMSTGAVYLDFNPDSVSSKRSRPPTSHQLAMERYRKERVNHILDRGYRQELTKNKRRREREGNSARAWKRARVTQPGWDSEEEAADTGAGRIAAARSGLRIGGFKLADWERSDYGEEVSAVAQAFRRLKRRMGRAELPAGEVESWTKSVREAEELEEPAADEMDVDEADEEDEADADEALSVAAD
jgi:Ino eighty subunit 1